MKIAFIGHKGYPSLYGGIEKVVEELANRFAMRNHQCVVYSRKYYNEDLVKKENIEKVVVDGIVSKKLDTLSHTFLSLVDVLKRDVDIITIHSFGNAILNFIPKTKNVPVVVHLHGFEWGQSRYNIFERKVLLKLPLITLKKYSDAITTVSIEQKKELDKRKIDCSFIPNGIEYAFKGNGKAKLQNKEKYILYVGRIASQKGIEYLIKAFTLCNLSGFKLKIVGGHDHAHKEYYDQLIELAGNNSLIEFVGYKYGEELNQLYEDSFCIVIPSESEECPMVLLEAMSFNKCIIASWIPGIYNIANDNVIYFQSKDHDDLAKKLTEVCKNDAIRAEYRDKLIKADIKASYCWDNIVDKYERLYKNVLLKKAFSKC